MIETGTPSLLLVQALGSRLPLAVTAAVAKRIAQLEKPLAVIASGQRFDDLVKVSQGVRVVLFSSKRLLTTSLERNTLKHGNDFKGL
jgi:hypothetical protein